MVWRHLGRLLSTLGVTSRVDRLLRNCLQHLDDQALLDESVQLLGEHLPAEVLASLANDAIALAGAGGLSEEEAEFANSLVEAWQLGVE